MTEYRIVRKRNGSRFQWRIERRTAGSEATGIQTFWSREEAEAALTVLRNMSGNAVAADDKSSRPAANPGQ